ncbi:type VI secretion protein, family [Roseibium sp. TrichSKD4]|nr:type VI secretion protein, family [Roseibium sp. TrichSKD4]
MRSRYFQDELTYLRESGRMFSESNPKLVKYLSERSTDPDVERILEGFAFLTSKLREKLDDELPELTHSVLNLLLPNFLRPFPAATMMKLSPIEKAITERQTVPKNTEVLSRPVDGVVCTFKTTSDISIYPLEIESQSLERTRQTTTLHIDLKTLSGLPLSKIDLKDLRLWFSGDEVTAQTLYLWFGRYLSSIELIPETEAGPQSPIRIPKDKIRPGGFAQSEAMLSAGNAAYEGYRLLREYFVFPSKFLCFDLQDLGRLFANSDALGFRITVRFQRPLPADLKVRPGTLRLYCSPAVNLFTHDAEPMMINHRRLHYPLRPSSNAKKTINIFSVDRVMSWRSIEDPKTGSHLRDYPPFESFHHEVERAQGMQQIYYRLRLREALQGMGMDHLLSFVRHDNSPVVPDHEVLSAELSCFNGSHAHELGGGDICVPTEDTPAHAEFRNLEQPTHPVYPPLDGSLYWTMISNLSLNYVSLLDKDALSAVLAVYDFQAQSDRRAERTSQRRLNGLLSIETKPFDKLFRGQPVRGLYSRMRLRESAFQSEGDMFLFASVLAEFFTLYASINSFHELEVEGEENNEVYQWPAKIGRQPII